MNHYVKWRLSITRFAFPSERGIDFGSNKRTFAEIFSMDCNADAIFLSISVKLFNVSWNMSAVISTCTSKLSVLLARSTTI